jgi:regulator of protease activity HflC (stomatin/prohibitin superfamily)
MFFDQRGDPTTKFWGTLAGVILGSVVFLIVFPFTTVQVGESAVVLRNGKIDRVLEPGIHFRTPLIEHVVKLDVTNQLEQVDATAASKDLQNVTAKIAVNYQIQPEHAKEVYSSYRDEIQSRVISPSVQEAVKAATAKYTAEELVTKRELVRGDIIQNLKEKLSPSFVSVSNVSIVNLEFSASFNAAIEAKVTAAQNALTAENKLKQVQFEADQRVATAEGEAKAIRLQGDAANSSNYLKLKEIEVALARVRQWDGKACQSNCWGSATGPVPIMQVGGQNN